MVSAYRVRGLTEVLKQTGVTVVLCNADRSFAKAALFKTQLIPVRFVYFEKVCKYIGISTPCLKQNI